MQEARLEVGVELAETARACEVLARLWAEWALPEEHEGTASLALEEALSNVIRHGGARRIRLRLAGGAEAFEFEIEDDGVPFNPVELPDPDIDLPLERRQPGGLGAFMLRQLADELRYEYRDGRNLLMFRKEL